MCTLIGETVRRDILLIYSSLDPEDTWIHSSHAWVSVVKLEGMRGDRFVLTKLYLIVFPDYSLKAFHASTKMKFM